MESAAETALGLIVEQDAQKTANPLDVRAQPAHPERPNRASCTDNRQPNRQHSPPDSLPAGCFLHGPAELGWGPIGPLFHKAWTGVKLTGRPIPPRPPQLPQPGRRDRNVEPVLTIDHPVPPRLAHHFVRYWEQAPIEPKQHAYTHRVTTIAADAGVELHVFTDLVRYHVTAFQPDWVCPWCNKPRAFHSREERASVLSEHLRGEPCRDSVCQGRKRGLP